MKTNYTPTNYDPLYEDDYDYDEYINTIVDNDDEWFVPRSKKMSRSFIYNRGTKPQCTDWNEHAPKNGMYNKVEGFIRKHIGKNYNKAYKEFCASPKFANKEWKWYGGYYTPKKVWNDYFENERKYSTVYGSYYVDEQGNIQHNKEKQHRHRYIHREDIEYNCSESFRKWNMEHVKEYENELKFVLGIDFVNGICENAVISDNKYDTISIILEKAKIPNKRIGYHDFYKYIQSPYFFEYYHTCDTIKYGTKEYNSAKKQIEAHQKAREKEIARERWDKFSARLVSEHTKRRIEKNNEE